MLKVIVITVGLFMFVACTGSSDATIGQYTTIEVDEVVDAGTVAKGELVKLDVKITNTGNYPLVIADVKGACSCTVTAYSEDPILPGKSSVIAAEIDTDQTGKGVVEKAISIVANTRPSTTKVILKARVID